MFVIASANDNSADVWDFDCIWNADVLRRYYCTYLATRKRLPCFSAIFPRILNDSIDFCHSSVVFVKVEFDIEWDVDIENIWIENEVYFSSF